MRLIVLCERGRAAEGHPVADAVAATATACGWSASNCSPTARSARAARGSSSLMPTSRTRAACSSIPTRRCSQLADTRGVRRLPGRDPRDRRCGQCAGDRASMSSCTRNTRATGAGGSSISRSPIRPTSRASRRPGSSPRCSRPTRPATGMMAEERLGPNRLAGAYAWQIGAEERREARVRVGLPGGIAQSLPRPRRRDQPAGHERPAAGRLDDPASG